MKYSILALLLMVGCGTVPPATQIVNVPVYTPCVTGLPARPDYEFGKLSLAAADGDKILALARDWPRGRAYEGKLEAAIAGCLEILTPSDPKSLITESLKP